MNNFSIRIKEPAEEWLKKYDKNIQQRFANKIRKLKEHPELHGKPLRKPLHGQTEEQFFSPSRYSRSNDTEICSPIGAISGHFQLQYNS